MHISRIAAVALLSLAALSATPTWAQQLVVYHIDNAAAQGLKGMRNVRNHLDVDAAAEITVVTHAEGVDMLMQGAAYIKP